MSERVWRWLRYGGLAAAALWVVRTAVLPAQVRGVRLTGVVGADPYYVELEWAYGPGVRPLSLIIDLEAGEARGSCTCDGETEAAEIPFGVAPRGPYRLTVSATYRVLGVARTVVTRAEGVA